MEEFGAALAAPGDINGDGLPDLIVGAPGRESVGAIYLIGLNADGSRASTSLLTPSTWDASGPFLNVDGRFGASIAVAPVSGDTLSIAVGAPMAGTVHTMDLSRGTRRARSLQTASGSNLPAQITNHGSLTAPTGAGSFGEAVAFAADYDGNGVPELVVGAPTQGNGAVYIHYMAAGFASAYKVVRIDAMGAQVSRFGRAIVSLGPVNMDDIVSDLMVGARDDSPRTAVGSVTILFMTPAAGQAPPSPPEFEPIDDLGTGTFALSSNDGSRDGLLIGAWVSVVVLFFLMAAWFVYFKFYRQHELRELKKTKYLSAPVAAVVSRARSGQVTPNFRLEFRGPSSAQCASTVRTSIPEGLAARPLPLQGVSSAPMLDPDVLLNVSYAPNVPHGDSSGQMLPPPQPISPKAAASATRVVDLSDATDALLRGDDEYAPNYVQNIPSRSSEFNPGYAPNRPSSCVAAPASDSVRPIRDRQMSNQMGAQMGASSEENYTTSDHTLNPTLSGVVPREPGADASLPQANESNAALLRI